MLRLRVRRVRVTASVWAKERVCTTVLSRLSVTVLSAAPASAATVTPTAASAATKLPVAGATITARGAPGAAAVVVRAASWFAAVRGVLADAQRPKLSQARVVAAGVCVGSHWVYEIASPLRIAKSGNRF